MVIMWNYMRDHLDSDDYEGPYVTLQNSHVNQAEVNHFLGVHLPLMQLVFCSFAEV